MMDWNLAGKVAVVTGGSQGIGAAAAALFAAEGAEVVICARRKDLLDETAERIRGDGGRATPIPLDVGDLDAYEHLLDDVASRFGRLDILVNNAPAGALGPIANTSLETWRQIYRVNVEAAFVSVRAAFRLMSKTGGGSIVNVSSVTDHRVGPGAGAYGSSKAALVHFSTVAAQEGAALGVRVNCISPGAVDTPSLRKGVTTPESEARLIQRIPQKRLGKPEEIARLIAFLASDASSYMTGANVWIDGGVGIRG